MKPMDDKNVCCDRQLSITFGVFSKSCSGINIVYVCQCVHAFTCTTKFTFKKMQYIIFVELTFFENAGDEIFNYRYFNLFLN